MIGSGSIDRYPKKLWVSSRWTWAMRVLILVVIWFWLWFIGRYGNTPPDSGGEEMLAWGAFLVSVVWAGPLLPKILRFLIADEVWLHRGEIVVRRGLIMRRYQPEATMKLKRVGRVAGWSKQPHEEEGFSPLLVSIANLGNLFPRRRRDFYELWVGDRNRDRLVARFYHPTRRMEKSIPPQIGMQLLQQDIADLQVESDGP